jgi:hypothetical protein
MAGAVVRGAGQIAKMAEKVAKESKKHAKDVTTKKKPNQKKTEKATKGQRTYREGQRKAGGVGAGVGYTAANVDLDSGKGLPIADMSRSIEVRGDGDGMRYFQDGKEVRLPKGK